MTETCAGCPLETMSKAERIVALGLADDAINHPEEDVFEMGREQREEFLTRLERAKPEDTPPGDRVSKPDTYARIATAFHKHFDPPIEHTPHNLKGN